MTKIEALQKTIYNLENDVYEYDWMDSQSCNCGILARTLLNGKPAEKAGYYKVPDNHDFTIAPWTRKSLCLSSGMELPLVWLLLKEAGFTTEDISGLETLSNETILKRAGVKANYKNKPAVIKYLKAWVEVLQEQQRYPDITKQLAVLPTEETTDVKQILAIK